MESKAEYPLRALIHMLWYEKPWVKGKLQVKNKNVGGGGTWIKIWVGGQSCSCCLYLDALWNLSHSLL